MDLDQLRSLLAMLHANEVTEFQYRDADVQLRLRLGAPPVVVSSAPAPVAVPVAAAPAVSAPAAPVPANDPTLVDVRSEMVGTFYAAPSPGAKPFAEVGQEIRVGQTLCIIEAMKLMNPIESEVAGTVVERLVQDGQPVEFGQLLFRVRRA
jgi:acetyl-CoA carboxylase biotin carboxyl carrier protein